MFRYLSSTLPLFPSKRGLCKVLLLFSSCPPQNSWQPDNNDLSQIQGSLTEGPDDSLDSLLDWILQCESQRTERDAAHQDSTFEYQFEKYESWHETSPPQGWPLQTFQNFSIPRLPEFELERHFLFQQAAIMNPLAPLAARDSANHSPEKGRYHLMSESSAYTSTAIVGGQATNDRPALVTALSSRECEFAGLGDVSQCTSVPNCSLTSQLGSTAMEEAVAKTVSASAEGDNDEGFTFRRKRVRRARPHSDEGLKLVDTTLLKMKDGPKTLIRQTREPKTNRKIKELVARILKFAKRQLRVYKDLRERQSLYGRIKDWAKEWENHSLDLHGRECEVDFYLTVGRPSLFCQKWFASCKDGKSPTIDRLTEIMEMEDFMLDIHILLRREEAAIFDDFQEKVFQRFCTTAETPQADRSLALLVMRNFSYRLVKVLSAELSAGTVTTQEDRHKFLKACLNLLERILTQKKFRSLDCRHSNCIRDACFSFPMWFELCSPPAETESDNLYIRAFEQLLSPHVAAEIRTQLVAQSRQNETESRSEDALTLALQEWMRTNVGEGSFADSIERVARRKQTPLKPRKSTARILQS